MSRPDALPLGMRPRGLNREESAAYAHLPYPPPYQDKSTLARHLSIGETTIDEYVEAKLLPAARQGKDRGKLLWKWSEVCAYVDGWGLAGGTPVPSQSSEQEPLAERVKRATEQSSNRVPTR